jgi:hypothetical protein
MYGALKHRRAYRRGCSSLLPALDLSWMSPTTGPDGFVLTHGVWNVAFASMTNSPGGRSNEADVVQRPVPSHALSAGD